MSRPPIRVVLALMILLTTIAACNRGDADGPEAAEGEAPPVETSDAEEGEDIDMEALVATFRALPTPDPAHFTGTYLMSSIGANSAIERTLILNGNLRGSLSTLYVDKSPLPIVESGTWSLEGPASDARVILVLNEKDGEPMDRSNVITLILEDDVLEASVFQIDLYGSEGLRFDRID